MEPFFTKINSLVDRKRDITLASNATRMLPANILPADHFLQVVLNLAPVYGSLLFNHICVCGPIYFDSFFYNLTKSPMYD